MKPTPGLAAARVAAQDSPAVASEARKGCSRPLSCRQASWAAAAVDSEPVLDQVGPADGPAQPG